MAHSRRLLSFLSLCACAALSVSFTPTATVPRLRSTTVACSAHRRDFVALGGVLAGGFLLGGGMSSAQAMNFEEFMAEKRRQEARDAAIKAGTLVESAPEEQEEGAAVPAGEGKSGMDDYKDLKPVEDTDPLKTNLVTVLRVQESTLQEERLIRTGQFKDLQRNNIKIATRMMLENSGINDAITRACKYAKNNQVNEANEVGRSAIEDLKTILSYFDESDKLKVTELSEERKEFITKALTATRQKLDKFLSYMPVEKVSAARSQVVEENALNLKEMPKDIQILNPIFMN